PRADRLGHADGAHHLGQPARARRAHDEAAHDVAAIGVEAQRAARACLAARRAAQHRVHRGPFLHGAVARDLVADLTDALAARVLIPDVTEVAPEAPVDVAEIFGGPAIDRKSPQQHEAAAVLELLQDGVDVA